MEFPPVRYSAIKSGLESAGRLAMNLNASLHMPRIGCGLAGGEWSKIHNMLEEIALSYSVPIVVYDLPKGEGSA